MSSKREDVIYLTLIDFFLQMLFLVMIALLAYIYMSNQLNEEAQEFLDISKKYGLNNAQELADKLQSLAPMNLDDAKKSQELINKNGGFKEVSEMINKMKEGQGKPPCLFDLMNDVKKPKSIANFLATNTTITLTSWEPEFTELSKKIGRNISLNQQWTLNAFTATWAPVLSAEPECRYTVTLHERSNLIAPRDRVQGIFYTRIRK